MAQANRIRIVLSAERKLIHFAGSCSLRLSATADNPMPEIRASAGITETKCVWRGGKDPAMLKHNNPLDSQMTKMPKCACFDLVRQSARPIAKKMGVMTPVS